MQTSLNEIREHGPCEDGWETLLTYLGKTKPDDEPLDFKTILKSNGINDTLWCVRTQNKVTCVKVALAYANKVKHLMTDDRSLHALDVCRKYIDGNVTDEYLCLAAWDAYAAIAASVGATTVSIGVDAIPPAIAAAAAVIATTVSIGAGGIAAIAAAADAREEFKTKVFLDFLEGEDDG